MWPYTNINETSFFLNLSWNFNNKYIKEQTFPLIIKGTIYEMILIKYYLVTADNDFICILTHV